MSGSDMNFRSNINEHYVWQKVISDSNNPNSLFQLAHHVRENARSIRNNISTELWEAINKWYLFIKNLDRDTFNSVNIFWFTDNMTTHIALIKSAIATTLLHNDIWGFINLGMYVERGLQVLRILRSKISDSIILSNNGVNIPLLQYQWTTLLKSLEGFDIYRYKYKGILSKETIFELILDNEYFPRSLNYSARKVKEHIAKISVRPSNYEEVIRHFEDTIHNCLNFKDFSNEEEVLNQIAEANECLADFHFVVHICFYEN